MAYQQERRTPIKRLRYGCVGISIWCDNRTSPDGKSQEYWSVVIDKTYRDPSGNWQYTKALAARDLTDVLYLVQRATDFIMEQQEQRRATPAIPEVEVETVVG